MQKIPDEIRELIEKLAQEREGLVREVIKPYSEKPFREYLDAMGEYPNELLTSPEMQGRRRKIAKITKELYFNAVTKTDNPLKNNAKALSEEIEKQLIDLPIANTSDHQAPLNHPFNLQGNILYMLAMGMRNIKHLFIVPFADIPLNNYCQPGGVFSSRGTVRIIPNKENKRLAIVTDSIHVEDSEIWIKEKTKEYMRLVVKSVINKALGNSELAEVNQLTSLGEAISSTIPEKIMYGIILDGDVKTFSNFIEENKIIRKLSENLQKNVIELIVEESEKMLLSKSRENITKEFVGIKRMLKIIGEILILRYSREKVSPLKYWEQISVTNSQIFKELIKDAPFEYVDIPLQAIVKEDLLQNHLGDSSSPIYKALFDDEFRKAVIGKFDGLIESWDISKARSSVLFVGINPTDGSRVDLVPRLEIGQRRLVDRKTQGDIIDLELTPENVKNALEEDKIIPGLPLSLIDFALYNGFKCFGGFFQVEYLDKYKSTWIDILKQFNLNEEVSHVEKIPVINYAAGVAQVMKKEGGDYRLANGVDILGHGGIAWEKLKELEESQGISIFASGLSGYLWEQTFFEKCPYSFEEIIKLVDPKEEKLIYI